jgi:translocation protein SEC63
VVKDTAKEVKVEIKFPAPPRAGKYKFTVHVISDSYLGLDHEVPFVLEVASAAELPEPEVNHTHKDDASAFGQHSHLAFTKKL